MKILIIYSKEFVNNQLDDGKLDLDDPSVGVTITEYEENIKIDKTLTLKEIPVTKKKKKKFC